MMGGTIKGNKEKIIKAVPPIGGAELSLYPALCWSAFKKEGKT